MVLGRIDNSAFLKGAKEETELQALQRQNQARINQERFIDATGGMPTLPQAQALTQGLTGLNLENFGGQFVDVPVPLPVDPIAKPEPPQQQTNVPGLTPQTQINIPPPSFSYNDPSAQPTPLDPVAEKKRRRLLDRNLNGALVENEVYMGLNFSWNTASPSSPVALRKFYNRDDVRDFIYANPDIIEDINKQGGAAATRKVIEDELGAISKTNIINQSSSQADKLISSRIEDMDNNNILLEKKSTEIVELANKAGVDPIAALAIFGIESDFGRATGGSGRGAKGSMQVTQNQFRRLKTWFKDPAHLEKVWKAYGGDNAAAKKVAEISTMVRNMRNRTKPMAGIAQLIYQKAIGLDKSLWGAGYQANADTVLALGQPEAKDDGNITNSDYNRAYVTLYNHILNTHGRTLLDKNKTLAGVNNNLIPQAPAPVNQQPPAGQPPAGLQPKQTIVANNRSNTTTGSGSFQVIDQGAGVDTGEPEDMSLDNIKTEEPEPPAFYQENPTRTGFDLQNYLDQRELVINQTNRNVQALTQRANYLRRLAEVERLGGFDPDRYNAKVQQSDALAAQAIQARDQGALAANDAEKNIMYLQGMQGLQDLQNGSVNRAAAVWSLASGQKVQINPRSDGRFDVLFNNKPFKTYDMSQLSDTLQLTFSEAFRKSVVDRASQTFEAQLDIYKQQFKDASAEKRERIKGTYDLAKEQYKVDNTVTFHYEDGAAWVQRGDRFSIIETFEFRDQNGKLQIGYKEKPVPQPGRFAANAFKREK